MGTERTTIRLDDDRKRLLEKAERIVSRDEYDEPPMSVVIDAALTHLVESEQNIQDARDRFDPETIQAIANTSVVGLRYRTSVQSNWR